MIAVITLLINSFRLAFGYSAIVKDYDALFLLGLSEFLIVVITLFATAMYNDFKD